MYDKKNVRSYIVLALYRYYTILHNAFSGHCRARVASRGYNIITFYNNYIIIMFVLIIKCPPIQHLWAYGVLATNIKLKTVGRSDFYDFVTLSYQLDIVMRHIPTPFGLISTYKHRCFLHKWLMARELTGVRLTLFCHCHRERCTLPITIVIL